MKTYLVDIDMINEQSHREMMNYFCPLAFDENDFCGTIEVELTEMERTKLILRFGDAYLKYEMEKLV